MATYLFVAPLNIPGLPPSRDFSGCSHPIAGCTLQVSIPDCPLLLAAEIGQKLYRVPNACIFFELDLPYLLNSGPFTLPNQFCNDHKYMWPQAGQVSEQFVTASQLRQKYASSKRIADLKSKGLFILSPSLKCRSENYYRLLQPNVYILPFPSCPLVTQTVHPSPLLGSFQWQPPKRHKGLPQLPK